MLFVDVLNQFFNFVQVSGNQYDSGNALNGQIPSYERSVTPVLQDFMDPAMCYLPNGYPSYYYGGKFMD